MHEADEVRRCCYEPSGSHFGAHVGPARVLQHAPSSNSAGSSTTNHGLKSALYGGSTAQVSGFIFFVPEKQVAVAFLFNLEDVPGSERSKLARDITDVVLGYSPAEPGAPAASPSAKAGGPTTK